MTPTELADLENLAALIDSRRGLEDVDEETLERLVAVFGLECLVGGFGSDECRSPAAQDRVIFQSIESGR